MTYAIFKAAGFQYRAELGEVLRLPSLDVESGATITFDEVLLGSSDGEVLIGRPTLEGAAVRAEVLHHGRADKVIVFKFKRRKNYRRKRGHRQGFTEVRVSEIDLGGDRRVSLESERKRAAKKKAAPKKKAARKKEPAAKAAAKPKAKRAAPKAKGTKAKGTKAKTTKKKTTAKSKTASKAKTGTKAKATSKSKKKS